MLVIPYRRTGVETEFAILKRRDADYWQFIAGGGEDDETPMEAAEREIREEISIACQGRLTRLDSMATVPKDCFAAADSWGDHMYVIPEYCFAIDLGDSEITLSSEHTAFRWLGYHEARQALKWDSNQNALWELNERLSM